MKEEELNYEALGELKMKLYYANKALKRVYEALEKGVPEVIIKGDLNIIKNRLSEMDELVDKLDY